MRIVMDEEERNETLTQLKEVFDLLRIADRWVEAEDLYIPDIIEKYVIYQLELNVRTESDRGGE